MREKSDNRPIHNEREEAQQPAGAREADEVWGMLRSELDRCRAELEQCRREREHARRDCEQERTRRCALLDAVPVGVVRFDMEERITYVNKRFCDILGSDREGLLGKKLAELSHSEDMQAEAEMTARLVRGEFPIYQLDRRLVRRGGYPVWVTFARSLQRSIEGRPLYTIAIAQDITRRRKTEAALAESERRFRRAVVAAPFPMLIYAEDGRIVVANDTWSELSGYRSGELSTVKAWTQRLFGTGGDGLPVDVDELYKSDKKVHLGERIIRTADGRERTWDFSAAPLGADLDGNRLVMSAAVDVTRLREAEQALRESDRRFRQLADSMPQLVWTARPDGTFDYFNERYRRFTGKKLLEEVEREPLSLVHPDDAGACASAWRRSVTTGETYQLEHRIRHADGTFHWYLSRAVPARDEHGRVVKWFGTTTNIDTVKHAQEKLQASEARLKALAESLEERVAQRTEQVRELAKALTLAEQRERGRLAQVLHDDLQQTLVTAKMRVDMIEITLESASTEVSEDVAEIRRLTQKALDTSRALALELNPPVLKQEGLDAAIRWLVHYLERQYGLHVELSLPGSLLILHEEERILLIQLIRQLLLNVVKHAGVNEAALSACRVNGALVITIEDKGVGFDVESERRVKHGKGYFGLFGIEERLRLLGAKLEIDSEPGRGTRSRIVVPLPEEWL